MAVLATVTALGGGIIRDVLIGEIPPAALTDPWVLTVPLIATVVAFFFHPRLARMGRTVLVFDAVGLGVFCATATTKAAATGIPSMAAVLLATITGVGGGILRDVLAGDVLSVLRPDSQLYAIPAIAGSVVVAVAYDWGLSNVAVQGAAAAGICGFPVAGSAVRLAGTRRAVPLRGLTESRANGKPEQRAAVDQASTHVDHGKDRRNSR